MTEALAKDSPMRKGGIKLNSEDSLYLNMNDILVPQPPDSITEYFLNVSTDNKFIEAEVVDIEGEPITNRCAKIGSYYRLKVNLSEELFLYIFSYDEDRNFVYLIYPINKKESKIIKKGTFFFPTGDNAIEAVAPAGRNFLKIFAIKRPIPFTVAQSVDWRLTTQELANFVAELKKLSTDEWSSFRIFLHVVED